MKTAAAIILLIFSVPSAFAQCTSAPLPTFPESPNWSREIVTSFDGSDRAEMVVWRKDCFDGTADLLITFRPLSGSPFFCANQFEVVQGGIRTGNIEFISNPALEIATSCPSIFFDTTFYVGQNAFEVEWDTSQAFTLIYDFDQTLDVGTFTLGGGGEEQPRPENPPRDFEQILPSAWFDSARQGDFSVASLPNNFTLPTNVPNGCLTVVPSRFDAPPSDVLVDEAFLIVDIFGEQQATRIRIWRQGCFEPGRSALLMNLELLEDASAPGLVVPNILLTSDENVSAWGLTSEFPIQTSAEIPLFSDIGIANAAVNFGNSSVQSGTTYVVDAPQYFLSPDAYNGSMDMLLDFGFGQNVTYEIPPYSAATDEPQLMAPAIHGRFSGQWTAPGLPRSGLVLQVGEVALDRNFVFAIWFTYLDGNPIWVVGNADIAIGSGEVSIPMSILDGGGFLTTPGSFSADDVSVDTVGTMTLRALHCNKMEAALDFTAGGLGQEDLELNRLIRIAGYDCDQTQ